jgi:hypothetical protein
VSQDRVQWRATVNKAMFLRIPFQGREFLAQLGDCGSLKRTLFHRETGFLDPRGEIGCVSYVQLWGKCDREIRHTTRYYIALGASTLSFCYIYNMFYFQLSLHQTRFLKGVAPTALILQKRCTVLTHTHTASVVCKAGLHSSSASIAFIMPCPRMGRSQSCFLLPSVYPFHKDNFQSL